MDHQVSIQQLETPYGQVALKFSTALLNGKFEEAHSCLGSTICNNWTPTLLQQTYEGMVEYFEIPPREVLVILFDTTMPNMEPESAWIYVSICGVGDGEGIAMVIGKEKDRYLIQGLEWGRGD
jgi:hypothetical protein